MPRIDTRSAAVVVARSLVEGGEVQLRHGRPRPVRLAVGQRLVVHHAYDYEEASWRRESFGFSLSAHADGAAKRGRTVLRDRLLVADSGKGTIAVAYRFTKPGRYTLRYWARAEYRVGSWVRRLRPTPGHEVEGRLTVVVA